MGGAIHPPIFTSHTPLSISGHWIEWIEEDKWRKIKKGVWEVKEGVWIALPFMYVHTHTHTYIYIYDEKLLKNYQFIIPEQQFVLYLVQNAGK